MSKTVLNVPKYKRSDGSGDIDDQNQTNRLCGRKFHDELGVNRRQRDDNSNSGLVEKPAGAKLQKFRITLEEPETVSRFLSDSFESLFKRDVFMLERSLTYKSIGSAITKKIVAVDIAV